MLATPRVTTAINSITFNFFTVFLLFRWFELLCGGRSRPRGEKPGDGIFLNAENVRLQQDVSPCMPDRCRRDFTAGRRRLRNNDAGREHRKVNGGAC